MSCLVKVNLNALEEKLIEEYEGKDPKRYLKHARRARVRKFLTILGKLALDWLRWMRAREARYFSS